jgi:hypothetical protein
MNNPIAECGTVQPPTEAELKAEVEAILRRCVAKGWIKDSGRRRKDQIVWERGDIEPLLVDKD